MKVLNKQEELNLNKIFGTPKIEKWLNKYPIFEFESVKKWIQNKIDKYTDEGKVPIKFNVVSYLNPLQIYCIFNEVKNPSDLLNEDIDQRNLRLKNYLVGFLLNEDTTLEDVKKLGFRKIPNETSVRNSIQSRIKSFFSDRGYPISFNLKSKKSGENKRELTLNKAIIKKIQNKLESPQYRLICKSQSQLGLRIGDVLEEMTNGKYIIEKYKKHYFIRNFVSQKRRVTINFLFFSSELADTFKAIMGIEDLTQLDLTKVFLTRNNTRIKQNDYRDRLKAIIKELGINGNIKTHALRKYFISQIGKASNILEEPRILTHLEMHEQNFSDQSYLRIIQDIDTFYNEWLKVENFICVDCILIDKTNEEIIRLNEEIIKLKSQNKIILKEKVKTEEKIKVEIAKFEEKLNNTTNENSFRNFTEKLFNAINNPNRKTIHKKHQNSNPKNLTMDIYTNILIDSIITKAKQELKEEMKEELTNVIFQELKAKIK